MNQEQTNVQVENSPQSSILSQEEVQQIVTDKPATVEDDVTLPSEAEEIVLPDKFKGKSAEDIYKAYAELEKKLGNLQPEDGPKPPVEDEPKEDAPVPTKALLDEYITKANENGGVLSDEHYAELEAKGFTRDVVDIYAEGIKAREQAKSIETLTKAGIQPDDYSKAVAWARENWDEATITKYNNAISSANEDAIAILANDLVSKYKTASKGNGAPIHSSTPVATKKLEGYADKSEMAKDMNDPRYGRDPRYTERVAKRVEATEWF